MRNGIFYIAQKVKLYLYTFIQRILYPVTSVIHLHLHKDAESIGRRSNPSELQFCFLHIFFPFLLDSSRLKIEVTYQRVGCRSPDDRHVSADFPIKPAEQLLIDGNQRLLSACPAIFLDVRAPIALHDRVRSRQLLNR